MTMPTLATLVRDYHRARCAVREADRLLDASESTARFLRDRMANYARILRDTTIGPAMRAATRSNMADDRAAVLRWRRVALLRVHRLTRAIAQEDRARAALARALRTTRTTTSDTLPPSSPLGAADHDRPASA
jgi:hypothetical protein